MPAVVPAQAQFKYEHSKKWSAAMSAVDGYIFVSPEYNYGIPGSTKNAIDYLYNEWIGKPVLIVTYGIHGGTKCSDALKEVLTGMKLRVMETRPQIKFANMNDAYAAIGAGSLGEETVKNWNGDEKEAKGPLLNGFEELVVALNKPVEEPMKAEETAKEA